MRLLPLEPLGNALRTPNAKIAHVAAKQHSVFSRGQALRAGFTEGEIDGQLRRGVWERAHRAVYRTAGAPVTFEGRAMAVMLAAGDGAVISHSTAARLFRVEGVATESVHVTVPRGTHRRIAGAVIHEPRTLGSKDVTSIGPIRVTTPKRTIIDLASILPGPVLEDALDDLLRRGKTTVDGLLERMASMDTRGISGSRKLKRLLLARTDKRIALSGRQNQVRRILERAGVKGLETEYDVLDDGVFIAQVDLAIPAAKLAIEFDSYAWHSSPRHLARDRERRHRLTLAGWPPLEVTEDLLRRPAELVARVLARLNRRGDG